MLYSYIYDIFVHWTFSCIIIQILLCNKDVYMYIATKRKWPPLASPVVKVMFRSDVLWLRVINHNMLIWCCLFYKLGGGAWECPVWEAGLWRDLCPGLILQCGRGHRGHEYPRPAVGPVLSHRGPAEHGDEIQHCTPLWCRSWTVSGTQGKYLPSPKVSSTWKYHFPHLTTMYYPSLQQFLSFPTPPKGY